MTTTDYLVEMTFPPFGTLLSPQEVVVFSERFVLPTLEACQKLCDAGRIVAGGTTLAAIGFTFIARTGSPQELEDMLSGLPLWSRAQTRIVPLGVFENRAKVVRETLSRAGTRLQELAVASPSN
jgi:hypothetical protein